MVSGRSGRDGPPARRHARARRTRGSAPSDSRPDGMAHRTAMRPHGPSIQMPRLLDPRYEATCHTRRRRRREINVVDTGDKLRAGDLQLFTLDRTSMNAKVLDLGGKDHTQNLISTINALDCEILARMGIKSAGTEKASGVTTEETVSITQELSLQNRADLMLRQEWIEKVRDRFPDLSFRLAPELEVSDAGSGDTGPSSMRSEEVA